MQSVAATRQSSSPEDSAKLRIMIVDDHPLMRRGLAALIDNEPDLEICASVATQTAGLDAIATGRPHLVIVDLALGDGDGLVLVKQIRLRHEDLPILVLTMHDAPGYVRRAFDAGAGGYVSKLEMCETLIVAIRSVLDGKKYLSPQITAGRDHG